jgi:hypothetical protein
MTQQIDQAIEQYLTELESEAELARDDLAELEDHMRSLIDELRATGATSEQAIAAAKLRLGDPKSIAREHARVRSPFGAKLSRARAWSAGGLFLGLVVVNAIAYGSRATNIEYFVLESLLGVVLGAALLARLSWARAAVAGFVTYNLVHVAIVANSYGADVFQAAEYPMIAMQLGVVAFLMPWRRNEIGPAGYALALVCVTYVGATRVIGFEQRLPDITPELIAAHVAHAAISLAGIGIVMRARWAAVMSVVAAVGLLVAGELVLQIGFPADAELVRTMLIGTVFAGALAAVLCTRLAWRNARTTLGSLRGFAS